MADVTQEIIDVNNSNEKNESIWLWLLSG